ncbi:hypothetical protein [Cylindrospermum stagnale]|uniref:hypothetical protein n=1 Tax=Cylindrospermum stagnale TaxID=142864 RepID=UPI000302924A|nr:hypothetical protein [Cylindrospermum stagnale]
MRTKPQANGRSHNADYKHLQVPQILSTYGFYGAYSISTAINITYVLINTPIRWHSLPQA